MTTFLRFDTLAGVEKLPSTIPTHTLCLKFQYGFFNTVYRNSL